MPNLFFIDTGVRTDGRTKKKEGRKAEHSKALLILRRRDHTHTRARARVYYETTTPPRR